MEENAVTSAKEGGGAVLGRTTVRRTVGEPLLIIGAGGFGREAVEVVRAINSVSHRWDLLGFLDDDAALQGHELAGVPVLGTAGQLSEFPDTRAIVSTGHPGNYFTRKRIVQRLGVPVERYATLVHPSATVPSSATLGPGSVLLAGVVLTTGISVGSHVVMMPGVVLTHDDEVGPFTTFGAGAMVAGEVAIGEGAYVGSATTIRERVRIGAWSLVGMGSVVVGDVPTAEVWAGVPAHRLREFEVPADVISDSII